MILPQPLLLPRLRELLDQASSIDIAVAWSRPGAALNEIVKFAQAGRSARIITGTDGNLTTPTALRALAAVADLRLGKQTGGLFHPKFYRFCLPGKTLGWVGSANLTGPAFAANCELVLEFEAGDADRLWFEEVWGAGVKASKEIIDAYEQSWVEPPAAMTGETAKPVAKIDTPFDLIAHGVLNWANYHRALLQADQWWLFRTDGQFGVLPGTSSWVETLRAASTIMLRDWERLSQLEYQILLGLKVQNKFDYGLLGSMSGAGYAKNIFHVPTPENVAKRRIFQRCTQDVITGLWCKS